MQSAMHVLSLWVDNNAYISGKTAKVKTERLFLFEIMAQVLRLSWPYRRTVQKDSTGGQYRRTVQEDSTEESTLSGLTPCSSDKKENRTVINTMKQSMRSRKTTTKKTPCRKQ